MSMVSFRKFLPKRNNDNNNVNPKEMVNQMISIKTCLDIFCILRVCQIALEATSNIRMFSKRGNTTYPVERLEKQLLALAFSCC